MSGSGTTTGEIIYLDGFATTALAPEAQEAMIQAWSRPGNAGSPHRRGADAARIVAASRAAVSSLIGASAGEIVFTSGATEANNLAVIGVAQKVRGTQPHRRRIVVSAIEHKAVLEAAAGLTSDGFEIVIAPVDRRGRLDLEAFAVLLNNETALISVMAANNETGVLQPVKEAAEIAHSAGALVHCDAAQAVGKIPIDVVGLDLDYASISAHKFYGPMGVGALFVSATAPRPYPLQRGGGQEQGLRSGTEPVPLIAGFGAAAQLAERNLENDVSHGRQLVERFRKALIERQVPHQVMTGDAPILPGSLSLSLVDIDAEEVVFRLANEVCLSTGAACNSGQVSSSHVLKAMGYSERESRRVLRVFCGRYNTVSEIDQAAAKIASALMRSALAPGELRQ